MPVTKATPEETRALFGSGLVIPGPERSTPSSAISTSPSSDQGAKNSTNLPSEDELNEQMRLMEQMDAALRTLGTEQKVVSVESRGPLEELLEMELKARIEAVSQDLQAIKQRFSSIDAHALAAALGIDDCQQPGSGQRWSFIRYARIVSVEEHARNFFLASELVYLIQAQVEPERFSELLAFSDQLEAMGEPRFDFLTRSERKLLELAIAKEKLEGYSSDGINCLAHISIQVDGGNRLEFEAVVEDDGSSFILRTPYDQQARRFEELSNCVTESW